jgi:hypothetical protein
MPQPAPGVPQPAPPGSGWFDLPPAEPPAAPAGRRMGFDEPTALHHYDPSWLVSQEAMEAARAELDRESAGNGRHDDRDTYQHGRHGDERDTYQGGRHDEYQNGRHDNYQNGSRETYQNGRHGNGHGYDERDDRGYYDRYYQEDVR